MARNNKGGRPKKLGDGSPSRVKILELLRKGISRNAACPLAGFSYQTLLNEIERDAEFSKQITEAEGHARAELEKRYFAASSDNWKAAESFLERKYYEDWGKRKPDSIEIRKLLREFPSLVQLVLCFVPTDKHGDFQLQFQGWIDRVLSDEGRP